mgnify:CR=1 FL=1
MSEFCTICLRDRIMGEPYYKIEYWLPNGEVRNNIIHEECFDSMCHITDSRKCKL